MSQIVKPPYTPEFRESSVKLAVESDQSVAQTARDLGVNENTLHTWINKYHQKPALEKPSVSQQHIYDELKELRRENKRLKEEKMILKKAAAYFASETL